MPADASGASGAPLACPGARSPRLGPASEADDGAVGHPLAAPGAKPRPVGGPPSELFVVGEAGEADEPAACVVVLLGDGDEERVLAAADATDADAGGGAHHRPRWAAFSSGL